MQEAEEKKDRKSRRERRSIHELEAETENPSM